MVLACALTALAGSCAKPEAPAPPPQGPRLVGRVASVSADQRFLLVECYGTWLEPEGSILTSRGDEGRTANLKVTGEILGRFAATDIESGMVKIGDAVYSRHKPKPKPAPETGPTPNPAGGNANPPSSDPAVVPPNPDPATSETMIAPPDPPENPPIPSVTSESEMPENPKDP